jgi:ABC-type transport system substrate-binding protein
MLGFNQYAPFPDHNLAVAESELSMAKDPRTVDPDDTYLDNGFSITVYYIDIYESSYLEWVPLKVSLESISPLIHVTIQGLERSAYFSAVKGGEVPLVSLGGRAEYGDPSETVGPCFSHEGSYATAYGVNNTTLADLVEKAEREVDPQKRADLYEQITALAYQGAYYIWAGQRAAVHAELTVVVGFYWNPAYYGQYFYGLDVKT